MKQEFNPKVLQLVNTVVHRPSEMMLYLLGLYYEVNTQSISLEVKAEAAEIGFVRVVNSRNELDIDLFKINEDPFEWVGDWIEGFGRLNKNRKGVKKDVISRMKKFFSENPEVRKPDVYAARDAYFRTVKDPEYLKTSHKFIYEGTGAMKTSMLAQFIEITKAKAVNSDGRNQRMRG